MRTMLVWRRAVRLPIVIDNAASTHSDRPPRVGGVAARGEEPEVHDVDEGDETAALDATDKNAVTGVGAPS